MITEENFESLLLALGFEKYGFTYKKFFSENVSMQADFSVKELCYPNDIKGRERNNNFTANENFVVFECVNRLLEKGYRPEHIELEKEWHLGHDAKGGRADICVNDKDGSTLFIIECKTWGSEFEKALKDTKNDGAQLFSYWQQENSCKWLVLYSSDFQDNEVKYKAPTINCSDDKNLILLAENDTTIKLYKNSPTVPEKFAAWAETYEKQIHDDLIFSVYSSAYNIGIKPLFKKDLRKFESEEANRIVNQFEEILRHNNVSDKENAFNRLIALFIAKLVDETNSSEDSIVKFQYRQGQDTYEDLQDTLQKLHSEGMEKFMREKIFYVDADYPEWLFSHYTGANRKNAIKDLKETIRKLKFYTNNDFAFKDVHNEELFLQNGKILVEVVQLFERYKIIYQSRYSVLGNLFEQLLNKGFKQNEGQFFTPIPITRFIWDCLPVERMIKSDYPKIIDYACGAGHFLTEAIEALNFFAKSENNDWARNSIYGIEKDYRLARVAKVSLFMNGAGEGNIIFGDGLENSPDKGIENGTFDILVSNPPYSVKDFSQYLQKKVKENFTLSKKIGLNGSEIETLFVERISQLLKPKGIAAVILPSSILSNDSASYTGAREIILRNFYIRAIVALGSKTFWEAGINTVVMFLEKFNEPPKQSDLFNDSVDAIFDNVILADWQDKKILDAYINQIGVSQDDYKNFLKKEFSREALNSVEYFKMYVNSFSDSQEAKKIKNPEIYLKKFYEYAHGIEREKILYFALVYSQSTVIITAPADNKEQKDFLGYDWSNRKGNEGMVLIKAGGKLYNDDDRAAEGTLANAVKKSFEGIVPIFNEEQSVYASVVNTRDMLDFSRVSFNKAMKLTSDKAVEIKSKFSIKNLGEIANIIAGQSPQSEYYNSEGLGLPFYQGKKEYGEKYLLSPSVWTSSITKESVKGDILMSVRAPVGDINLNPYEKICIGRGLAAIKSNSDDVMQNYLYYVLKVNQENITGHNGLGFASISVGEIKEIKIPVPPLEIQQKIISECEAVDDEYNLTRMSIENYHKKIEEIFTNLDVISGGG